MNEPTQQHEKRVLLVDQDWNVLEQLSNRFKSMGLNTSMADNDVDAVLLIDRDRPDLLVFDVDFETADGGSILEVLDQQEANWHIPSIVLCNSMDLNSVYRSQNIPVYYVQKSPTAWHTIKMFAGELVDLGPSVNEEFYSDNNHQSDLP